MSAPLGNKFWLKRNKDGRNRIFDTPSELWESACCYFEWVIDNPLLESKAFAYQGVVTKGEIPKLRAMTKEGLYIHLGIGRSTWDDYKARDDFSAVCEDVENIIREQKFTGAAAGLLNPSIIASDLGLDKSIEKPSTVINNIMPVPVADSVEDWERAAKANQDELLHDK